MEEAQSVDIVQGKLILMFLAAVFATWINYKAWKMGYYTHPANADAGAMRLIDVFGAFGTFLVLQILVIPLLAIFWFYPELASKDGTVEIEPIGRDWMNYVAIIFIGLGLLFYTFFINPRTAKPAWGSASFEGNNVKHFMVGVFTWLLSFPVVVVIGELIGLLISQMVPDYKPEQTAVKQLKETVHDPVLFWSMVAIIITAVPIIEELLFRGYLQTWIKGHLGYKWAIVITAAVFALFHYSTTQGIGNLELLTSLFILALFLGWVYEKERSLWASIGLHATFNALSIGMIILGF